MSHAPIESPAPDAAPPRSTGLLVLGAVVGVAAALALFVVLAGSWGITEMYGSDAAPLVGALPWAALPAALMTASWAVTRAAVHRSARRWWVVLLALWAAITVVVALVVWLADQQYDGDADARASACSIDDVRVLTAVPGYSADFGEPTGQDNGDCAITIPVQASTKDAVDVVVADLAAQGWEPVLVTSEGAVIGEVTRAGVTLLVIATQTDDKGWTDVQVVSPAV